MSAPWRDSESPVFDRARAGLRMTMLAGAMAAAFTALSVRLIDLASRPASEPRGSFRIESAAGVVRRADLVDRNGALLARDAPFYEVWANPSEVIDPEGAAAALSAVFPEMAAASIARRLRRDARDVSIRRRVEPRQAQAAFDLGLPGLHVRGMTGRVYPQGALAAHVIGHVDAENRGIAGLELGLDDRLRSDPDRPVTVALDVRAQAHLEFVLSEGLAHHGAIGAAGVVIDAWTGDVLAAASLPDHDPRRPAASPLEGRRNRATLEVYELGSVFKTFSMASVLDAGVAQLGDEVDAAEPLAVADRVINDFHPENRTLTISEVMIHSSNIGSAKLALDAGASVIRSYYGRFGLLDPWEAPMPEMGRPMTPRRWGPTETATVSYGHGLAVTPLHVAVAAGALVTDGLVRPPRFVLDEESRRLRAVRAVSETTAVIMRTLLRRNVLEGTGDNASVPGYAVLGKTGTADKVSQQGGYDEHRVVTSFLGAFPGWRPRYVTFVMLDEPQASADTFGFATAGWNVGPMTADLIEGLAPIFDVTPRPMLQEASG